MSEMSAIGPPWALPQFPPAWPTQSSAPMMATGSPFCRVEPLKTTRYLALCDMMFSGYPKRSKRVSRMVFFMILASWFPGLRFSTSLAYSIILSSCSVHASIYKLGFVVQCGACIFISMILHPDLHTLRVTSCFLWFLGTEGFITAYSLVSSSVKKHMCQILDKISRCFAFWSKSPNGPVRSELNKKSNTASTVVTVNQLHCNNSTQTEAEAATATLPPLPNITSHISRTHFHHPKAGKSLLILNPYHPIIPIIFHKISPWGTRRTWRRRLSSCSAAAARDSAALVGEINPKISCNIDV